MARTTPAPARRYGCVRDRPDARDRVYAATGPAVAAAPPKWLDGPRRDPPVDNQSTLGACTGFGGELGWFKARQRAGHRAERGSALFIYYAGREAEGTVAEDAGLQIRTVMRVVAKVGVAPRALWPYRIANFARRPPEAAWAAAAERQVLRYARVPGTLAHLRAAVAADLPVIFGFEVPAAFEDPDVATTGEFPAPDPRAPTLGGHCVAARGYDDDHVNRDRSRGAFLVRNQYGRRWGIRDRARPEFAGHFWFPYNRMVGRDAIAYDHWVIHEVERADD